MLRLTLITLFAGLCLGVGVAVAHTGRANALGAATTPVGSPTNPDGTSGSPVNTVAPTLSTDGSVKVGRKLTCAEGIWANDPTAYRERWRRSRKLIHIGPTYRVTKADRGHTVSCYVTATNAQGNGVAAFAGSVRVLG